MKTLIRTVDTINEWMGELVKYFVIVAALITCLEVTQRYVFNRPTMWGYELPIMIACSMYCLAWGYVHKHKGHVRVDIVYSRLSDRVKAVFDSILFVCLFMPVIGILTFQSWNWMMRAWRIGEKSVFTYWYPPIAPLRTLIFVGIALFLLQGLVQFWRDAYHAVKGVPYD